MMRLLFLWMLWLPNMVAQAQVDFRKESIYFLLPTRFFDGDSTNNRPNEWCSYIPGVTNPNITDPQDVTWRGDFKGLMEKLDYIKGMGFTAIWITPIVQNRGPLDYHGYHAWDFMKTDPRLESPGATFEDLVAAVHAKGMKIVLDIVSNHSGRYGVKDVAELKYNTDTTKAWGKNSNGTALLPNPNWEYDGLTPNPDDQKIWSRAGLATMPAPYNQNLPAWNWPNTESFVTTSNPNWFHHSGNGFAQGWDDTTNLYQRAIADDCPDLNTGSALVQNYLFQAYKRYLDAGVDAFRWDTWKHMNKTDIFALYDRLKAYKPDLFVFGEVAQKRHELHTVEEINPHWYTWRGAVGGSASAGVGVLDFFAESTFHGVFEEGGSFSGVTAAARYDHLYGDPSLLVTWLDNHDFGPNNDWNKRYSGSDENLAACLNFMFTWRGIPSLYYGTEKRFKSGAYCDLHDGQGTQKSLNETGRAYFGDEMATASSHIIYRHLRKLNAIRKAIPALQTGSWSWAGNAPGNGVGYTRQAGTSFVCVGLAKDGAASFQFTSIPNGIYRDAVTGRTQTVSGGSLLFTVTSGSAGIYVKDGPGMIGESGAGFFEPCALGCNTPVTLQIAPVGTNYAQPVSVSMTAAGGSPAYQIRYTTNGAMPTASSPLYTGPFLVDTTVVVRAIAFDQNGATSELAAQRYTFILPPPQLSVTPASGNYYDPITVEAVASGTLSPYRIFYTTDGSLPDTLSTLYSVPLTVSSLDTLRFIAKDSRGTLSPVITRSYTFQIPAPTISLSPDGGNFNTGTVLVTANTTSPRPPVTIYYTVNGAIPTVGSSIYTSPIQLNGGSSDTLRLLAVDSEGRESAIRTAIYTYYPIPDITVFVKRPAQWGTSMKIHYWNGVPAQVYAPTTWPGVAMTPVCGDWYQFTFSGITSTQLIFTDGLGHQTGDLTATATAYYDNGWLATAPNILAPVAEFSASPGLSGAAPFTITFNGAISSSCQGIQQYTWDFGNGNTASGASPTATYLTAGNYWVTLTITDGAGEVSSITKAVLVAAASPGFWVYFQKPSDWASTVKLRYWGRNPGNLSVALPGVDATPVCGGWYKYFFANTEASFLQFHDDQGKQSGELQVNQATSFIGNRKVLGAPLLNETIFANFEMSPANGVAPLSVTMDPSSSLACNTLTQYRWNFGDGTAESSLATPTHVFADSGVYSVKLTVTDNLNQVHTSWKQLVVGASGGWVKLHFRRPNTWSNTPHVYFWNPSPALANTAWPGTAMTNEGNGWYVITLTGAQCTNLIFNNQGAPQSSDFLNVCGEQWYDNGWLSSVIPGAPIPVRLLQFRAGWQGQAVVLNWQVAQETGIQQYEIERSTNGWHFAPVAQVAARNLPGTQSYQRLDPVALGTVTRYYYRLRIHENGGRTRLTPAEQVMRSGTTGWQILPTQITHQWQILTGHFGGKYHWVLSDAMGKRMATGIGQGTQTIQRRATWLPGWYMLDILPEGQEPPFRQRIMIY